MRIMKLLLSLFLTTSLLLGCKKDKDNDSNYQCTTCVQAPEALAVNDNSSKGIYKGVIIGSTGTISFNLANSGNTISAVMVIDGTTVNLSANVTWQSGQAYVAPFTGTLNGQAVSITFSVGATGENPTVTSATIPGHANAVFIIAKETSIALVEGFEGTYTKPGSSGTENGTFNMLLVKQLGKFAAIGRKNGATSTGSPIVGTYSNGAITTALNGGQLTGRIDGDKVSGSLEDQYGKGSFNGKRTL